MLGADRHKTQIVYYLIPYAVRSSRPGEFHPRALPEPDVRLSPHPAPPVPAACESNGFASATGSSPCRLTHTQGRTGRPPRSTRITRLHRYDGPVRPFAPHRYFPPCGSSTWTFPFPSGRQVPTFHTRACAGLTPPLMPVAARPVGRHLPSFVPGQRLEPGFDDVPTLSTLHRRFTHVRLPNAHLTGFCPPFPSTLTTPAVVPAQLPVVWDLTLQPGPEGPSLISRATRLLQAAITASFPHRRGAQSSAYRTCA